MNKMVFKIVLFLALCAGVASGNTYYINGPLLKSNTEIALKQFEGTPATAGGLKVGDYWVPFNVVYTGEAILLALAFSLLFGKDIRRLFTGTPASTKES